MLKHDHSQGYLLRISSMKRWQKVGLRDFLQCTIVRMQELLVLFARHGHIILIFYLSMESTLSMRMSEELIVIGKPVQDVQGVQGQMRLARLNSINGEATMTLISSL